MPAKEVRGKEKSEDEEVFFLFPQIPSANQETQDSNATATYHARTAQPAAVGIPVFTPTPRHRVRPGRPIGQSTELPCKVVFDTWKRWFYRWYETDLHHVSRGAQCQNFGLIGMPAITIWDIASKIIPLVLRALGAVSARPCPCWSL
ncbi:hypothetical protein RJZ90_000086 [Blastomyces dermatitidis]